MYKKLLLCQACGHAYCSIEVPTKRQSRTAKSGQCYNCNLQTLLATKATNKPAPAKPKPLIIYNGLPLHVTDEMVLELEALANEQLKAQPKPDLGPSIIEPATSQEAPAPPLTGQDLSIGRPPNIPPVHLIADEPDVIEYTENGAIVYRWTKHVDPTTGQKFYQDQTGNKWYYKKL